MYWTRQVPAVERSGFVCLGVVRLSGKMVGNNITPNIPNYQELMFQIIFTICDPKMAIYNENHPYHIYVFQKKTSFPRVPEGESDASGSRVGGMGSLQDERGPLMRPSILCGERVGYLQCLRSIVESHD